MRRIEKAAKPQILAENEDNWSAEFAANPRSDAARYRYRHKDIKRTLLGETANKCVYCESKIGHVTPGDVEHKIPTSVDISKHFCWDNLTIACTECNRRKLNYYSLELPFFDPYIDDVDNSILHFGPIVGWFPGDARAEATIRRLELHSTSRTELLSRKVEAIDRLNNLVARIKNEDGVLRDVLLVELENMKKQTYEYSGMLIAICSQFDI